MGNRKSLVENSFIPKIKFKEAGLKCFVSLIKPLAILAHAEQETKSQEVAIEAAVFSPLDTIKRKNSMRTKQIRFTHDAIAYSWDDVPEEKYRNWVQNTNEVLNTKDYTAWGFPFMLQVEPTSLCNLSCTLCPTGRHELNRPYRHMRLNEFKSLIDDMERYLLFLVLWDWGEPLMNPELPSMICYASERGIQTVTSTNAHFLNNEAYTEELLKSGLTTLIVAVDSILADKYEVYRKNGDIGRVLGGLNKAVSVKKRIGSKTLINVRMVIMRQNEHEIEEIENMARVSGADVFTVKSLNPSCGMVAQDEELLPTNLRYRRYEYIPNTYERMRTGAICRRIWTMSNIFSNGDVVPCCYDYDSEMKVGNIFETPFTQIWNNSAYRQLRKKIYHEMQTISKCNHCGINFKLSEHGWFVKASDLRSDHMQISFSIIMAAYNRKHCIKNAIDSLLAQTYKNFELIIIDDSSTDGTEEYLMEMYKEEIKKEIIRFIKLPEKKGASFARNEGLRKARYNWIGYLDTDNQMHEDFLETFADSIEKNSSYEIYYAQIKYSQSQSIIGHEFIFDELAQFNFIDLGVFVHSTKIYNEIGGFDVELCRLIDWDFIIKYTEKYPPKFVEKILLDYDDNPESLRISNNISCDEAYKQVIINYYKRISPQKFIGKHTGQITHLKQAVAERDVRIISLGQTITARDTQISHLQQVISEGESVIRQIHSSTSWRLTRPLRALRTLFLNKSNTQ
jgi:radical SAM protein with 4Fe4S-binding SPASM domain